MPFSDDLREVYDSVYKPVCDSNAVDCWRVDEIARPGSITQDIIDGILDADIVLADLTSQNPNVFYELGIAHSVGNKTVMTSQSLSDVPFDIANYRIILYEQSITGSKKLTIDLDQAIKELLASLDQTNNPVQEAFGRRSVTGFKQKRPLVQLVNIASLNKSLRDLVEDENVRYVEDLATLDLEEMKTKYGLGESNLTTLVSIILESESYGDLDALHKFILKHRLKTANRRSRLFRK